MDPTALWGPIVVERTCAAPPDEVFAAVCDPDTYPRWLVGAQRMRRVDPEFPAPGAEFHHSVGPTEEATVDDRSAVVAVENEPGVAPLALELLVHAGPFHADVRFEIHDDGPGSLVRLSEVPVGPARALTPLLRVPLRLRNARSLQQLSAFVEAEAASRRERPAPAAGRAAD